MADLGPKVWAESSNSSLLQGEQHQDSGNKLCNILDQIDGKLLNLDAKWSQNGVWAPSGAKMAPERQKRCPGPKVPIHFGGHFRDFGASFSMHFFEAFLEGFFVASRATLERQRWPKRLEN